MIATDRIGTGFVEELQLTVKKAIIGDELMSIRREIEANINLLREHNFIEDWVDLDISLNLDEVHIDDDSYSLEACISKKLRVVLGTWASEMPQMPQISLDLCLPVDRYMCTKR